MAYQDTHQHHDGCFRWLNTRFSIKSIEDKAWAAWPNSQPEYNGKKPRMGPLAAAAATAVAAAAAAV